jgi:hypothetical protein|tara:strand:- start:360 stop:743 length:384 start_codon:yes stop_codon:yes gene_type:complete
MAEDICFEFLIEVFCWIIIAALWEIGIQILMSMGMSYSGAEGLLIIIGILAFFLAAAAHARRRKLLGKAVVLDTDGDGYVSEEEWAEAGQDMDEGTDEEEVGDSSSEDDTPESEKGGDWWEEGDEEK